MSSVAQPIHGFIGTFIAFLQGFSTLQLILLVLVNIPILAIVVNVVRQLVCGLKKRVTTVVADASLR